MGMLSRLGFRPVPPDEWSDHERARRRLIEQEERVKRLDRAVEVIQRRLPEDRPHASG